MFKKITDLFKEHSSESSLKDLSSPIGEQVQISGHSSFPTKSLVSSEAHSLSKEFRFFPVCSYCSKSKVRVLPELAEEFNKTFNLLFKCDTLFNFYVSLVKVFVNRDEGGNLVEDEKKYWFIRYIFLIDGVSEEIKNEYMHQDDGQAVLAFSLPNRIFTETEFGVDLFEANKQKTVEQMGGEIEKWIKGAEIK
jgi:hypothetical protein